MRFAPMKALAGLLVATTLLAGSSDAADAKYYFELSRVSAKPAVKPDAAKMAIPRVKAQVEKVFNSHPQAAPHITGAPDPKANADAYRSYLAKKGIQGAFRVDVAITEASEKVVPGDGKTSPRLEVKLALHMVGEKIADSTIGFNGHGNATIKQEGGDKVSDADRDEAWKDAVEFVVDKAMKTALEELAAGPKGKK